MKVASKCLGCHKWFNVNNVSLTERKVEITQKELTLTLLTCPLCGQEMTVGVDDSETLNLLQMQMNLNVRIGQTQYFNGEPTEKQKRAQEAISSELIQKRNQLVHSFNGSIYQFQEQQKKLNYSVPTTKIVGEKDDIYAE